MSMLDGVSQCWWLSKECVIWWDAWAAIGTVTAVFTAIFAPSIQRRFFTRKKANAVFAAAFNGDVIDARIRLEALVTSFPSLSPALTGTADGARVELSGEELGLFEGHTGRLETLAHREIDGSKWPNVDLDLLLAMTHAIKAAEEIVTCGKIVNNGAPVDD